jgi:hypothetical protein
MGLRQLNESLEPAPTEYPRISFETLQSLFYSIPPNGDINDGEYSRIVARIREWYRVAHKWQEEALSIAKTGSNVTRKSVKTKVPSSTGNKNQEVDDFGPPIDSVKLNDMITANILSKVRGAIHRTKVFRFLLHVEIV